MNGKKLLGILGGMGPEATVYFFKKIVEFTEAERDQEHIPIMIYNYPQIPDRVCAYVGCGESPLRELINGVKKLQSAGADIIAIPCNSAHLWLKEIQENTNLEILNMIELTVSSIKQASKVGLLATTLTVNSGLYETPLRKKGIEVLLPDNQEFVMEQIRLIKRGQVIEAKKNLLKIVDNFIDDGASHILAGCTEIPLALNNNKLQIPLIDPMDALATECIIRLGGRLKKDLNKRLEI